MELVSFVKSLGEKFPKFINKISIFDKHNIILDINKQFLFPCFYFLKKHSVTLFMLLDITALDFLTLNTRYIVVYQLLSINYNFRLTIKSSSSAIDTLYPSLISLFPSANWLEREVWDMFGLFFSNHSDLRRILTDYGFQGFPLRKDFPLTGFVELSYSEEEKRIIYSPLELSQEYRLFDFLSSWQL